MISLADRDWFADADLQAVLALLNKDGAETRLVGGVVRNALMNLPVSDFDLATTLAPDAVMARAQAAGLKVVPTGIAHGTVTIVVHGRPFEVTTLRLDVATDGRHAEVAFTDDWQADANRRDFTINALYVDQSGLVHDLVGGIADIETRTIRFIGEASERIAEDHLRILRFFRFFAHYGAGRPDAAGLKACAAARSSVKSLSAERVWAEFTKLLAATDCGRALLWMRTTGILTEILPESEKWGIDAIPGLVAAEQAFGWKIDPMLRLLAIVPPDPDRLSAMADRLRLSRAERDLCLAHANAPAIADGWDADVLRRTLYRTGRDGIVSRLKLMMASKRASDGESLAGLAVIARLSGFLDIATEWVDPILPVSGKDLMAAGLSAGPDLGAMLKRIEDHWVDGNFAADRKALLDWAGLAGR